MEYKIFKTDKFENSLSDIIFYIANEACDANVALNYLEKIENNINLLRKFPLLGVVPRQTILKKHGYRVLTVEKHLIFYKVENTRKRIMLYNIVDSRRNYINLIG